MAKSTLTVVPSPSVLSMVAPPPWLSLKALIRAKPSPVPPWARKGFERACSKGWPSRLISSAAMPMPVADDQPGHGVMFFHRDADAPAPGGEFDRIGQKIEQDLFDRAAVGGDEDRPRAFDHQIH